MTKAFSPLYEPNLRSEGGWSSPRAVIVRSNKWTALRSVSKLGKSFVTYSNEPNLRSEGGGSSPSAVIVTSNKWTAPKKRFEISKIICRLLYQYTEPFKKLHILIDYPPNNWTDN